MDANADPNRDLKRVIKFLFGKAPEPFWQLALVLERARNFSPVEKIWSTILVKTRAYRYQLIGKSHNIFIIDHRKIPIIQEAGILWPL